MCGCSFCSKGYTRSFIHDYLTVYHDAAWHIAHNTLLAGTHAVIPALKKLRDSGHQILVIHGEIDTTIRFRLAEEMSRTFSNVELVGVPEKGHVDVVWGRAKENALLIEKAIRDGDNRWSGS
jgi:pimeloyl-ACP methyl ester carboxylesterase